MPQVTSAICQHGDPESVLGCDSAALFVEHARHHVLDHRASFVVTGVGALPRHPNGYQSVASLLALNFFPDSHAAIAEQRSLVVTGGTVSACVWDYAEGMGFLRRFWDAAADEDPAARDLDEGRRFPICRPDQLVRLFESAGLSDVICDAKTITTKFTSFDDYWQPFLGGTGPAASYVGSLDEDRRRGLAARLAGTLPKQPDGSIALTARAWAVRGTVR